MGAAGELEAILPGRVYRDEYLVALYSREPSGARAGRLPSAVVFPESLEDVRRLVRYAYRRRVPLYPQGSATSLSGSAVPEDGVVVSMERMDRVRRVSLADGYVEAEAGVRLGELNALLAARGYMFPVDPASQAVATVGGAVNSGAGGMRGARYGTMRDWVLGLEAVVADEEASVIRPGCLTVKCRQGYDVARLIVGSEGTLAVVVSAVLRVTPLPEASPTVLAFFPSLRDLAEAVVELRERGLPLLIAEFMDEETVSAAAEFLGMKVPRGHMLLASVETCREAVKRMTETLLGAARRHRAVYADAAPGLREAEERGFLRLRRSLFPAQLHVSRRVLGVENPLVYVEDVAVPPSRLPEAVEEVRRVSAEMGLRVLMGGHVGDGNLHPAVGFDPGDPGQARRVHEWFHEVMRIAVELGGTVSAEHGIGLLKKQGLRMELEARGSPRLLELMAALKRVFDPRCILNPGKVVDCGGAG